MKVFAKILLVFLFIVALSGYGGMFVVADIAVSAWWWIVVVALFAAATTGLFKWQRWQRITRWRSFAANFVVHTVLATGVVLALCLGVNMVQSPSVPAETVECKLAGVYRKEHRRTRRVSARRYVANGEKYYTYSARVVLPDGRQRKVSLTLERYNRLQRHRPDSITLQVRTGLLGIRTLR